MKKSILNLVGAQELSKNEQKGINGGIRECQRWIFGYTPTQCLAVGGYYVASGSRCLVTIAGCGISVPVEL